MSDGLIFPDWPVPENVIAGTTTRHATRDLLPDGLAFLNQVHGAVVVTADGVRSSAGAVDADAVVGCAPGEICAVRTADCLPVLSVPPMAGILRLLTPAGVAWRQAYLKIRWQPCDARRMT